jgi:tryptophan synthase beta chain
MKNEKIGYFGKYGGMFIPEILKSTFDELIEAYNKARNDTGFWNAYVNLMSEYSCRPTPISPAENLTKYLAGAKVFIKREDLNHTGAHKANNVMGQGLLVKSMKKSRVIAETGAGQHGMATATMAAKFGLKCTIYMGAQDVARQHPNVFWMKKLGAEVVPVYDGTQTLKEAINAAFRDWSNNMADTHYVMGTVCGPHPFPEMVAWLQSIIGKEAKKQMMAINQALPNRIYACVGGGSNALGIFGDFVEESEVDLIGVEAGGLGVNSGKHAVRIASHEGRIGVCQGYKSLFLQDEDGQMKDTHSVAAGLDYVGVSPILANHYENKRVRFESATDEEVLEAAHLLIQKEGIIPALESAHAFAAAFREIPKMPAEQSVLINLSGRGDKDIFNIAEAFDDTDWKMFIRGKGEQYDA